MQFTVDQSTFDEALSLVSRAVPSRPSHPVLASILLSVEENKVRMRGFDLATGIEVSIEAEVESKGEVCLPSKLLGDIWGRLPQGEVQVSSLDEGEGVRLKAGKCKFSVTGMSTVDYPELPEIENDRTSFTIPSSALLTALDGVLSSVSTDETKQILQGVHVSLKEEALELAGTDGHRLAVTIAPLENGGEIDVAIPGKALNEVAKLIKGAENVDVSLDEVHARFSVGDRVLLTRLLKGQYPNYSQLIPKTFSKTATLDRTSFMNALSRVAVIADQKNSIVKIEFAGDEVAIGAESAEVGSGRETLEMQLNGDALNIAFNVKYLLEGLKAMDGKEVLVKMNTATSPAVLEPLGEGKMTYLVMPVQIRE